MESTAESTAFVRLPPVLHETLGKTETPLPPSTLYRTGRLRQLLKDPLPAITENEKQWKKLMEKERQKNKDNPKMAVDPAQIKRDFDEQIPGGAVSRLLYAPFLAELLASKERRTGFLARIDEVTQEESERIKKAEIKSDILIIGTGPQGTTFANTYRDAHPNGDILFVDQAEQRGGQFRDKGAPFRANSPNELTPSFGLELEKGNPNDLGGSAILQPSDVDKDKLPSSDDKTQTETLIKPPESDELGAVIAVNNFVAGPAAMEVKISSIRHNKNLGQPNENKRYEVRGKDKKTGKEITFYTDKVLLAIGLGEETYGGQIEANDFSMEVIRKNPNNIFTGKQFLERLPQMTNEEIIDMLKNRMAIVGGAGDFSKIIIEEIVQRITTQGLPPESITLFGANFTTAEEYERVIIPRYAFLTGLLQKNSKEEPPVKAYREKIKEIDQDEKGQITLTEYSYLNSFNKIPYGTVVFTTGYRNVADDLVRDVQYDYPLWQTVYDDDSHIPIAQQLPGEDIYVAGPSAKIPLSETEEKHIPKIIQGRLTNSLRRHTPLIELLAFKLAREQDNRNTIHFTPLERVQERLNRAMNRAA